jgi:hypothetical protein
MENLVGRLKLVEEMELVTRMELVKRMKLLKGSGQDQFVARIGIGEGMRGRAVGSVRDKCVAEASARRLQG